jgi:hypothetical protein
VTTFKHLISRRSLATRLEQGAMVALALLGMTFALEVVQPILSLGDIVLTNVEGLVLLTVALWIAALSTAGRWPAVPRTVARPTLAWLAALLVSALLAPDQRVQAVKFVGRMATGVLVAWVAYDLSRTRERWRTVFRALSGGGLLVAVLGLAEAAQLPAFDRFLAAFKESPTVLAEMLRVSSTLSYATIASMVLELSVPLLLAWLLTVERRGSQVVLGAGLLAMLATQVLTLTRGGLFALVAALGFMGAWAAWQRRRRLLVGSLATIAVLVALWGTVLVWHPLGTYRLTTEAEQHWYEAAYRAPTRLKAEAGETLLIPVTVTNSGVRTWQASGENAFRLGFHLAHPDTAVVQFEGGRVDLSQDVPAGADVQVRAPVTAPRANGEYVVEWDMVQEGVTWFSWTGTAPGRTQLTVVGAAPETALEPDRWQSTAEAPRSASYAPAEQGRMWLWQVAAGMFADRPLFGVGPDNFRWLHGVYAGVERADNRVHANNLYIEWLVDTGIVGFTAFLWLTWGLARAVYPALAGSRAGNRTPVWQLAVTASLVAWFAHGAVDFFYGFTPTYVAFALLSGLALSGAPGACREGQPCGSDSM